MATDYIFHLLIWILPIIILQWIPGRRIFPANWRAIVWPTLLAGTYYSISDVVAIREGIWYFDEDKLLGLFIGPVPLEECLFFYLTALLVAQSFVLLLPDHLRHPARR